MAEKNSTDLFKIKNKQELDVGFSIRRHKRTPIDENSLLYSYAYLEEEMKSPDSFIYKGQIVVTQGLKDIKGNDTKSPIYYSPWLIKNDTNDNTKFYADRIVTATYNEKYLDDKYVKKTQLGTKYTGVGQWADVKGKETNTTTYSEVFNDYETNFISIHENNKEDQPYLTYAHAEGYGNSVYMSYAHVEGKNNIIRSSVGHAEGMDNQLFGYAGHVEGVSNIASGAYSHAQGAHSKALGEGSFASGIGVSAGGIGSIAFGRNTYADNSYSFTIGIDTRANADYAVAEGNGSIASGESSHAEGNSTANGTYSHAEGHGTANGTYSHAEADSTANGEYSHVEGQGSVTETSAIGAHAEGHSMAKSKYSHSEGIGIVESGIGAHAEGHSTANSDYSHAEGNESNATGIGAHAEGHSTANSDYSHAEGNESNATGIGSHAEGNSIANGDYSHAEGHGTTKAKYAHAEGNESNATGIGSHAEGNSTANGDYSHAEGNSTANGDYSHAEGAQTKALGVNSHTEGNGSEAHGQYAHAEGNTTKAKGLASHVEGNRSEANGDYSHAEGNSVIADGNYSHVEGNKSNALGDYSHAEGRETKAQGIGSHTEGYLTVSGRERKDVDNNNIIPTNYGHAEGCFTTATGDFAHTEGTYTATFNTAAHAEGAYAHARGTYSHAGGFYSLATNTSEFAIGKYNRSYTAPGNNGTIVEGENIRNVSNEFARVNNKYLPGRFPTGITDKNNLTNVGKYDDSYTTVFSIGNGSTGDTSTGPSPLYKDNNQDAGQYVKAHSRHNIMDIRKNGQMYYDGGMIIGGEVVAPTSYSYVNSLGPTAYLTTVMRALLVQPKYYRPSLQYAIWYTGNRIPYKATSNDSVGWSYFQNSQNSDGICEVGATTSFEIQFRAFNVGVDKPQNIDPIYGTSLGNMLGYSTGIREITYFKLPNNSNISAQKFDKVIHNKELLAGMKSDTAKYWPKRLVSNSEDVADPNYIYLNDTGEKDPYHKFNWVPPYDYRNSYNLAYYSSYCNAVDNRGAFGEIGKTDYRTGLYSTRSTISDKIKLDMEGKFTVWTAYSYIFNPATQMYFQQLMEKATYIPDDGAAPYDKFTELPSYSSASFTLTARYRIYYGTTNDVPYIIEDGVRKPNPLWKKWTQNEFLGNKNTTVGRSNGDIDHGHLYGNLQAASGQTQQSNATISRSVKTCWFAYPTNIYKLCKHNSSAIPKGFYMYYKNQMNVESALDTGVRTPAPDNDNGDALSTTNTGREKYEFTTDNPINPSGLRYHIVAVTAPDDITKGTWGFAFERK